MALPETHAYMHSVCDSAYVDVLVFRSSGRASKRVVPLLASFEFTAVTAAIAVSAALHVVRQPQHAHTLPAIHLPSSRYVALQYVSNRLRDCLAQEPPEYPSIPAWTIGVGKPLTPRMRACQLTHCNCRPRTSRFGSIPSCILDFRVCSRGLFARSAGSDEIKLGIVCMCACVYVGAACLLIGHPVQYLQNCSSLLAASAQQQRCGTARKHIWAFTSSDRHQLAKYGYRLSTKTANRCTSCLGQCRLQ